MNEALKLHQVSDFKEPEFKDGDGGDGGSVLDSLVISVVDNGYVVSGIMADLDGEIDFQEVFYTTDEVLKRVKELLCM